MTRVIIEDENEPPIETPASEVAFVSGDGLAELTQEPETTQIEEVAEQLEETQETTAAAIEEVADDIGDLYDVVAALVSAVDSIVDYLQDVYDAEIAEGHQDIEPPTEPEQKTTKAKKALADTEPGSRHKVRPVILGRSGGIFK